MTSSVHSFITMELLGSRYIHVYDILTISSFSSAALCLIRDFAFSSRFCIHSQLLVFHLAIVQSCFSGNLYQSDISIDSFASRTPRNTGKVALSIGSVPSGTACPIALHIPSSLASCFPKDLWSYWYAPGLSCSMLWLPRM